MTQTTNNHPWHQADYDVIIIGAGIVGSMIARELSKYNGRFALIEKEPFSGFGVSKANPCMLHSPLMFPSGPLRIKLAYNAAARYKKLAAELDVTFKEVDEIFLAFDTNQMTKLKAARAWADQNKISAGHKIVGPEKIREIEPHVSQKAIGALYASLIRNGPDGNIKGECSMEGLALETPNPENGSFSISAKRPLYLDNSLAIIEPTMPAPMMMTS